MASITFQSVDQYIAAQPEFVREILERVRKSIRKSVPEAEELISYNIPTYKLHGRPVVYFAGWKQHFSIYPATGRLVASLAQELEPYEISKGTIRFPLDRRVPAKLIERIAKFRATEVVEAGKPKPPKSAISPRY